MEVEGEKPPFYGPVLTIILTVAVFMLAQVLAVVLLMQLPEFKNLAGEGIQDRLKSNPWRGFQFMAVIDVITIGSIYGLLRIKKLSVRTIGLNRPQLKYIGYALGAFVIYFGIYIISLSILLQIIPGLDVEQKQEIGFDTTAQGKALWPVFLSLVILPPITEEIVVRGFLFSGLRSKLPFVLTAVITSVIFAFPHLLQSSTGLLWLAGIDTFILSLVLCYLREKTGSLWPSIGVHMLKNGLAFVILFNILGNIR